MLHISHRGRGWATQVTILLALRDYNYCSHLQLFRMADSEHLETPSFLHLTFQPLPLLVLCGNDPEPSRGLGEQSELVLDPVFDQSVT
jgi:hypothetical protein